MKEVFIVSCRYELDSLPCYLRLEESLEEKGKIGVSALIKEAIKFDTYNAALEVLLQVLDGLKDKHKAGEMYLIPYLQIEKHYTF